MLKFGSAEPAWDQTWSPADKPRPAELSVVVPTLNERANLDALVAGVRDALAGEAWEIIIVDDDSPDGTADYAHELGLLDPRVRVIRRVGRRGLSSACIEGWLASDAPYFAVMDADGQHDPALLPAMLRLLRAGRCDLAVGSRYVEGGSIGGWDARRAGVSRVATRLARTIAGTELSDPMSGFFALSRAVADETGPLLSAKGFKLLLDLVLRSPRRLRVVELPFRFGVRSHGRSKFSVGVAWDCLTLMAEAFGRRAVTARAVSFLAVGALGLVAHLAVLSALLNGAHLHFATAQAIATAMAMVMNYSLNNVITYADRSLSGRAWAGGLVSFSLICGSGALANLAVATFLFHRGLAWAAAAVIGVVVGSAWNYAVSARYTWRQAA